MKHTLLFLILAFCSPLWGQDIHLAIGESTTLPSKGLQQLVIQKKGILSIHDYKNSIRLTGKKLGKTNVRIGKSEYTIQVLHRKQYRTLKLLQEWAKNKRGPLIVVKNKEIHLTGRLLLLNDWLELKQFCHSFCSFKNQINLTESVKKEILSALNQVFVQNNLATGSLSTSPYYSMRVPKSEKKNESQYKEILRPFGITLQFDDQSFLQGSTIEVKVYVAHLKRSFLRQWGLQWPTQLSATLAPGETPQIGSVQVALNALEASGNGQLLASPTLVTESGKEALFHSGGEFPIQTSNTFNNTVNWKRYGLTLKTTPTSNAQKNLKIRIDLEISTLDQSQAVNSIPGINRSHLNTEIVMKSPRPIFLSGFLQKEAQQAKSGVPWLSQIPLFSPLFSTGQIHNTEYELVFILLPRFYDHD